MHYVYYNYYQNTASCRQQAVTKAGKPGYDIVFPKYKKGSYIVKKVTKDPTYGKLVTRYTVLGHGTSMAQCNNMHCTCTVGYLDELLEETIKHFQDGNITEPCEVPEPLCSEYDRPKKKMLL